MVSLDTQIACKKQELEALKKITALTDSMKLQLDELAGQVRQMQSNAETVSQVMENWNSITKSISQAGLSLLQYAEGDYEVGVWAAGNKGDDHKESVQRNVDTPLPETLVRIRVDEEDNEK